jgi:hypothetical protein
MVSYPKGKAFENRRLRRIFGFTRDEEAGGVRQFYEELRNS